MLKKIAAFFRPRPRPTPAPKIEVVQRDVFRLTVEEWRADENMVKIGMMMLRDPNVRIMLDVLRNSHLSSYTHPGNAEQKAFHLCRCEGYQAALMNFENLGLFQKPEADLIATFGTKETETLED